MSGNRRYRTPRGIFIIKASAYTGTVMPAVLFFICEKKETLRENPDKPGRNIKMAENPRSADKTAFS